MTSTERVAAEDFGYTMSPWGRERGERAAKTFLLSACRATASFAVFFETTTARPAVSEEKVMEKCADESRLPRLPSSENESRERRECRGNTSGLY